MSVKAKFKGYRVDTSGDEPKMEAVFEWHEKPSHFEEGKEYTIEPVVPADSPDDGGSNPPGPGQPGKP